MCIRDSAKDMTTALPTDFSVKGSVENAMPSAVSGGSGKSGFVLQLNIGKALHQHFAYPGHFLGGRVRCV